MDANFFVQCAIATIMALGILIGSRQLALLRRQLEHLEMQSASQYEWNRRIHALTFSLVRSPELRAARIQLDQAFGILARRTEALTLEQINGAIDNDPAVYTHIMGVLAHWENMALSVDAKVADEEVAFAMVAGLVISFVRVFRNFIEERRRTNPRAYEFLVALQQRWELRLKQHETPSFAHIDSPSLRATTVTRDSP